MKVLQWLALMSAAAVAGLAAAYGCYTHRRQPLPERRMLFEGVIYSREVLRSPRPLILHAIEVDLKAPGVGFLVTPGDPALPRPLRARRTSTFLREFHAQVAVNGDYFFPFHSHSPLDYYPHEGDPVELEGYAWSGGRQYCSHTAQRDQFPLLYLSRDNRASFDRPAWPIENAISGICMLTRDGVDAVPWPENRHADPCTSVALSRDRSRLYLFLAEGRQPNYSEGVTLHEFAQLILDRGGSDSIDLDGGGSETLAVQGPEGGPVLLNSTIDHRIPGWERPVANHIGIFARQQRTKGH